MTKITDETLSAFLDGELPLAERERVEAALNEDDSIQERLLALTKADAQVSVAIRRIDDVALPAGIEALLAAPAADDESATVIPFPSRPETRRLPAAWQPAAIAASLAALIGFGAGAVLMPKASMNPLSMALSDDPAVIAMLDGSASAVPVSLGKGAAGEVRLTFTAGDGTLCREFHVTSGDKAASAVACKTTNSPWIVRLASLQATPAKSDGYQTASSPDERAFGAAVESLMASDPIDAETEAQLIKNHWQLK